MSIASDLKTLFHMVATPIRGKTHAERLDSFYSTQASGYDDFRKRLLRGREEMFSTLPWQPGQTWVDLGGGTGANLEAVADRVPALSNVYVVDLAESLLRVCQDRVKSKGWSQVQTVVADATTWTPPEPVDVVTFSYSLTMIPDWFAAIDNALRILKPDGTIGVVDFFVGRKYPDENRAKHGWFTRICVPAWFHTDNVFLGADHVPYLQRRFETLKFSEQKSRIPYLPFKAPYYIFHGRKPVL